VGEPIEDRDGITVDVQPLGGPGRGRRSRATRVAGAGLAGLVVLGIVAVGLSGPRPAPSPPPSRAPASAPASAPATAAPSGIVGLPAPAPPDFAQPSVRVLEVSGDGPVPALAVGQVPEAAERVALLVGCSGEGVLRMRLDGVAVDFDCARRLLDGAFVPPLDGESELVVEATGALRYVVQVRAWSPVAPVFRPPGALLSGGGRTVPGHAGCGLAFELADGTSSEEQCGPSWMPIPDDRAVSLSRADELVLSMMDGWTLTQIVTDITDHAGIVGEDRDVPYARLDPHTVVDGARALVILTTNPGDFGLRLTLTAERDGATFTVPYYFRVRIGG
jgi:hypothetical protein